MICKIRVVCHNVMYHESSYDCSICMFACLRGDDVQTLFCCDGFNKDVSILLSFVHLS